MSQPLKDVNRNSMESVIVVGGGMAGLSAAYELARNDIPVTVLEAKPRWGGRIHTLTESALIELGAEFVHGRNPTLLKLIAHAGLTMRTASDRMELFENGSRHQADLWEKVDAVFGRIDPDQPDVPFERILEAKDIDERARTWCRNYVEGFNAADSRRISAHSLLRSAYSSQQIDGSWQGRVDQGYGALVQFLVRNIKAAGGNLFLNSSVHHIDWQKGKVEVSVSQGAQTNRFEAEAAVLALPLGVWKAGTVSFRPALANKLDAVQQLEFGNVVKLILEFRERWWDTSFGFLHAFYEPFPTWWQSSDLTLTAWAGGAQTDELLALSQDQLISKALGSLGKMMSQQPATLQKKLRNSYFHNWAADPEIRGAYSYIPVNGLELPKLLAEPVQETLYFAGEATVFDAQTGTTFGALESGMRAASQILE